MDPHQSSPTKHSQGFPPSPPHTPPPIRHCSLDSLHIHYCDFAYEQKGPFCMLQDIGETTAKTFAELLSGSLVDIYVGRPKRRWSLHRNILCHHSTWFQNQVDCVDQRTAGCKEPSIELFDDDPKAFELLVKWLYQGKIDDVGDMPMDKKWDFADTCQQLYVLCDKIRIPELKNLAIDQFRRGCFQAGLVPGPEEMMPIYDKITLSSSPLRKLISRIAARQIMDPENECDAGTYRQCFERNVDFAIDVINAIKEGAGGRLFQDPTEEEGCYYHEHPCKAFFLAPNP